MKFALSFLMLSFAFSLHSNAMCADKLNRVSGAAAKSSQAAPFQVTLATILKALEKVDKELSPRLKGEDYYFDNMAEPYNAFFYFGESLPEGETWKKSAKEIKLTQNELDGSWQQPVHLSPMPLALYQGHIFPGHYFVRRTTAIDGRGRFRHSIPDDLNEFANRMPYVKLERDGKSTLYQAGGSAKLFNLLTASAPASSSLDMFRAASKVEFEIQSFIKSLLEKETSRPLDQSEVEKFRTIMSESNFSESNTEERSGMEEVLQEWTRKIPTRLAASIQLAGRLSIMQNSTMVSFSFEGAEDFKKSPTDVVIHYKMPLDVVRKLIGPQLYLGVEINYFELAFVDEPLNQLSKFLLYRAIVSTPQ